MLGKEHPVIVTLAVGLMATALTPPPAAPAEAAAPARPLTLLVRVDRRAADRLVRLPEMMREMQAIWKPYADLVFADTTDAAEHGFDDELRLVVSGRPPSGGASHAALGWITFPKPETPDNVVTVSVAAAHSLMARAQWSGRPFDQLPPSVRQQFITRALGRSAAHEIGHYLLRSSAHAEGGLMRRALTIAQIMDDRLDWFRLGGPEVDRLQRRGAVDALLADADPQAPRSE